MAKEVAREPEWDEYLCETTLALDKEAWLQIRKTGKANDGSTLLEIVADAIAVCEIFRQPPPIWLVRAADEAREQLMSDDARHRRDEIRIHHLRFNLVRRFMKQGMTKEMAYAATAQRLEGTPAHGSEEAVKRSYKMIYDDYCEPGKKKYYVRRRRPVW